MKLKDDLREQLDGLLLDGLPDLVNPADLARRVSAPSYSAKGLAIAIGRWLAMIGARPQRRLTKSRKTALTIWSLHDHEHYQSLGPTERLRLYRENRSI